MTQFFSQKDNSQYLIILGNGWEVRHVKFGVQIKFFIRY